VTTGRTRHGGLVAWGFALPALLVYGAFLVYPARSSLWFRFTDWDGLSAGYNVVGLDNYRDMAGDPAVRQAAVNNLAVRPLADFVSHGPLSLPGTFTLGNFADAWNIGNVATTYRNSTLLLILKVPLGVFISAMRSPPGTSSSSP
jgi:ABC-type sugar transport system permease subunit